MKFKQVTISRYWKWKETAKKSAKFTTGGVAYTQTEFETLIGHKSAEKVEAPVNTIEDVTEEDYADMEQQDDSGDTEES